MTATLSQAQRLKFALLERGLTISAAAADVLADVNQDRPLTPADYASTSGVILRLDDDVWVNAPIGAHNPNFVDAPPFVLELEARGFFVRGAGLESVAQFWVPPLYHGTQGATGPLNNYVFTHADRARLSPIQGCIMRCTFCNVPYDDRYGLKSPDAMVEALQAAIDDAWQPAQHLLISGGTPAPRDIGYLRDVYTLVLTRFASLEPDIMMVPLEGLLDLPALDRMGVHEISINLEVFNAELAEKVMRHKYWQGRDYYLRFLENAASELGGGRVRSMLMVGLEPMDDTLAGVRAIVDRGCVPVLSPFRPDPATPLSHASPPSAQFLEEAYLRAADIASDAGVPLGPSCPPCSHNTLTLFPVGGDARYEHPLPRMVTGRE